MIFTFIWQFLLGIGTKVLKKVTLVVSKIFSLVRDIVISAINNIEFLRVSFFLSLFCFLLFIVFLSFTYIKGFIIFGEQGKYKARSFLINDYIVNDAAVAKLTGKNDIITDFLMESLDEDFDLSSNDLYNLYRSIGLSNQKNLLHTWRDKDEE